jgi:hypothetical protein
MMGMEAAKGAAFMIGMHSAEKLWKTKASENPTPENNQRVEIQTQVNKAMDKISPITDEWAHWLSEHYDARDSFGTLTVGGVDIIDSRFCRPKPVI